MSNVWYLAVKLIINFDFLCGFLVVTACYLVVNAGYCSLPGGYWWLLVVAGGYCSLLLVPTFSMNVFQGFSVAKNCLRPESEPLKISLTSNNFSKTDSEKHEEIHDRDTKYYIENICHQLPDL